MIGSRLIFRRSLPQHILDFIDKRLAPRQRGALIIPADSFRDRSDGSCQPKQCAAFFQCLYILCAKYGPTAGVDDKTVTSSELPADLGLQIAEIFPSFLGNDLWNRAFRALDNLLIGGHKLSSQSHRKQLA